MPRIECLTIAAFTMFLAVSLHAKGPASLSYDASVLLPGSRVVAGDLSKDEFFITGGMNTIPVKVATAHVATTPSVPLLASAASHPHQEKPSITPVPVKLALASTHRVPLKTHSFSLPLLMQANAHKSVPHARQFVAMKATIHPHQPVKVAIASHKIDKIVTYTRLRNEAFANKITLALKQAVKNQHHGITTHQVAVHANKPRIEHKTTYYRFTKVTKSTKTKVGASHRSIALAKR
jgi:hypothetical protein